MDKIKKLLLISILLVGQTLLIGTPKVLAADPLAEDTEWDDGNYEGMTSGPRDDEPRERENSSLETLGNVQLHGGGQKLRRTKKTYTSMEIVSGSNPDLNLYIMDRDKVLDFGTRVDSEVRFIMKAGSLFQKGDFPTSLKFDAYTYDNSGNRVFISKVHRTVFNKKQANNLKFNMDLGLFESDYKSVYIDLYDKNNLPINTYRYELAAQNITEQTFDEIQELDPADCSGTSFDECHIKYFLEHVEFQAVPKINIATEVSKRADGSYLVNIPIAKRKLKIKSGIKNKAIKTGNDTSSDNGSTSGFNTRVNIGLSASDTSTFTYDTSTGYLGLSFPGTDPSDVFTFTKDGRLGIGTTDPQGYLNVRAGDNTFPSIKMNSGSLTTVPQDGALEYDGNNLYFTTNGTRAAIPVGFTLPSTLVYEDSTQDVSNKTLHDTVFQNSIQIPTGAGDGKILTSDASGFATWQTLNTISSVAIDDITDAISVNGNVFLGNASGINTTNGQNNSALGIQTLQGNTLGDDNLALGFKALKNNNEGNGNLALGSQALIANTNGNLNIALGKLAGSNLTTGSRNIMIGNGVQASSATVNDELNIANAFFGNLATKKFGIGVSSSNAGLQIGSTTANFSTTANDLLVAGNAEIDGTIYGSGSGITNLNASNFSSGTLATNRGGTGVSNASGSLTFNKAVVFSGTGSLTFNTTASTTVTLPTTGTLATLSNNELLSNKTIAALDGSAALPSYSFAADSDTGIFRAQSNELAISTGGTTRLTVTSAGNIGIGVSNPDAALEINGQIKVTGGSPQTGYVLSSSDNEGLAEWVSVSSLVSSPTEIDGLSDAISDKTSNVFLGNGSGLTSTGLGNTATGILSLAANTNGDHNVALGYKGLTANTTGNGNLALGYEAGKNITSGSKNIMIGNGVQASSPTVSNELNIGNAIYGNLNNGNIGIGVINPSNFKLESAGSIGPNTTSAYDLGSSSLKWATIYVDTVTASNISASTAVSTAAFHATGNADIDGNLNVDGNITTATFSSTSNASIGGNLAVTGNGSIGGDLSVTGDITATNMTASNNMITSNLTASSSVTLTSFTQGNIPFIGAGGALSESNNFTFNGTNAYLGINTNSPNATLSIGSFTPTHVDGVNDAVISNDLEVNGAIFATDLTAAGSINANSFNGTTVTATNFIGGIFNGDGSLITNLSASQISTGVLAPQYGGTGVSNTGTITTGTSNISFTTGNNVSFNTSGATSIALPTSGILATQSNFETLSNKVLLAQDGSAASPSMSFSNSPSSGFYSSATDEVSISTAGNQRLVISSSGNVGIGVSSPDAALEINGQIKITGGSPSNNFVLTSDADGLATWQDIGAVITLGTFWVNDLNDAISDKTSNIFMGNGSGLSNTGDYNTSLGISALQSNLSGNGNTAVGFKAGFNNNGDNNIALGYLAMVNGTTASNNTILGANAARTLTTGTNNILIGQNVDVSSASSSNELNIGNAIYGNLSNGKIGIGVNLPTNFTLEVNGSVGPDTASAYDLGSSSLPWKTLHADTVNGTTINATGVNTNTLSTTGNASVGGNLSVAGNTSTSNLTASIISAAAVTTSTATFSTMTQGSLLFVGAGGLVSEDNDNLFYDNASNSFFMGGTSSSTASVIIGPTETIEFNKQNSNQDFRIAGILDNNLFYVDASSNRIGIGTNTPGTTLDIGGGIANFVDGINGDLLIKDDLEVDDTIYAKNLSISQDFALLGYQQGSVLFFAANGVIAEDTSNFRWNNDSNALILGGSQLSNGDISLVSDGQLFVNAQNNNVPYSLTVGSQNQGDALTIEGLNGYVGIATDSPNSTVHINGSLSLPLIRRTSAYTLSAGDYTILTDASSSSFTITLPSAAGIAGRIYVIKKVDGTSNQVTVQPNGGEQIDGSSNYALTLQNESIQVQSDGSDWYIF